MNDRVVHCKKDKGDVYIGRPSPWGNKFSHLDFSAAEFQVSSREEAISSYKDYIYNNQELLFKANRELKNKILSCYCRPLACHGDVLVKIADAVCLFRPVGNNEFKLIEESGYTKFPPRLPEQPIFYPITNFEYANEIASKWNKSGHVVKFLIDENYISKFPKQVVGSKIHEEYWIPAEQLEEFNSNIVGKIFSIKQYGQS